MADYPFTKEDLDVLAQWDTPTICNALEIVMPERRAMGFTVEPMVALDPAAPPMVGLARTGTIRA
ncbi:MAG: RraA family protein, partial [Rhodospirillales bacterium]|nr:RraA family protein [Rhodospirillales bacterium]